MKHSRMSSQRQQSRPGAQVERIFRRLRGARGVDEHDLWQHALYFAKTPEERCRISLQTARLALSLRRFVRKRSDAC